ncbi:MAG TPA: DUF448 domain-containing protein [Proteobacteria bacterium]|nr:putative ribosomal protein YlxQ [bacterium BMS3Abin14]HDL52535.1 DUF448 domain-containing protein [Pseudomonadota bacterium]
MAPRSEPVRTCTGCGKRRPKGELIRVVMDPATGKALADLKGKLPARGAYVCPARGCIEAACRGRLARALKGDMNSVGSPEEFSGFIAEGLKERILSLLGLAQRGGRVVSGASLVTGEIRRGGSVRWLAVVAEDASDGIALKLMRRLMTRGVPVQRVFGRAELGAAVGKGFRSVLLVKDAGLAVSIEAAIIRYFAVR